MMKPRKWVKVTGIILLVATGIWGLSDIMISNLNAQEEVKAIQLNQQQAKVKEQEQAKVQEQKAQSNMIVDNSVRLSDGKKLPNGNLSIPNSGFNVEYLFTEYQVQEIIHEMSHEKVKANEKWGQILITQERISTLQEVLNRRVFDHAKEYKEVLDKWSKGDYSTADGDHNMMWELQHGTIGKATGLLGSDEETKAVNDTFHDVTVKSSAIK